MRSRVLALSFAGLLGCAPEPPPAAAPSPPAPSGAPRVADATPPKLRLPELARPTRVDLDLAVDPEAPKFFGEIAADLDVLAPTDVLWLNANDLTITSVEIAAGGATQRGKVLTTAPDFVGLGFDAKIAAGKARLTVRFEGDIERDKARGIYAMKEPDGARYVYTFFEPVDARRAFPCFDEPNYKVPWRLTLHVPKGDVARANSAIASERDEPNGRKAVVFEESKPLPSYLVAFVVGPFDVVSAPDAGHHHTKLSFLVPKGRGAETRYAAEVTPKIVGYLEDYFGMPYPWGKLDVAVVPRYWGTMEHPGIVALGQTLTLIKASEENISRKQEYANIASHELAHYWFGDYVTMRWWDDTWLNESMAQWMDAKITDRVEPAWKFGRVRLERANGAMVADGLPSAKSIREPVVTADEIANAFDGDLTYNKGNAVLAMFEEWMTVPVFQRAIHGYLEKHAFGSVVEDDLLAAIDAERPGAGAALRTFIDQPGVPLVEVKLLCDGSTRAVEISQRRYAPAGVELPPESWKLPVCVRYGDGKGAAGRACTLLTAANARMPIETKACPTFLLANAGGAGYYRAKYDKLQIDAIFRARAALEDAELTTLMNDAGALVERNDLALGDALALLPNVAGASDRYLFASAFSVLGIAGSILGEADRPKYAHYVREMYKKRSQALGWKKKPGESKDDEILRPLLHGAVAIAGQDDELRKEGRALATQWIADRGALDADIVDTALASGARLNDRAFFDLVLKAADAAKDQREKERLYNALGEFDDPELVKRAQAIVLDRARNLHDTIGILWAEFGNRTTRQAALAFLDQNFEELKGRLRDDESMYLGYMPRSFCDDAAAAKIEAAFTARAAKIPGAPRMLKATVETVKICAAHARAHGAGLTKFLARY